MIFAAHVSGIELQGRSKFLSRLGRITLPKQRYPCQEVRTLQVGVDGESFSVVLKRVGVLPLTHESFSEESVEIRGGIGLLELPKSRDALIVGTHLHLRSGISV